MKYSEWKRGEVEGMEGMGAKRSGEVGQRAELQQRLPWEETNFAKPNEYIKVIAII